MSAYLCSNKHISTLVRAAIPGSARGRFAFYTLDGQRRELDRRALGTLLYEQNVRSLVARYGDNAPAEFGADGFRMEMVHYPSPLDTLKLCNGYAYQACETDDWKRTDACAAIDAIKDAATHKLPGYDDAPWSL